MVSVLVLVTLVATLPLPLACKPKESSPVEGVKGKITIGLLDGFTSPAAGGVAVALRDGTLDAVRYVNERMGGISGHPLDIMVIDAKMESASVITGWDRLKNEGVPVILSGTLGVFPLVSEISQKSHLPMVTGTINDMGMIFPKEASYAFCTMPAMVTSYYAVCELIEKEWAKKGETRPPKIGFDIMAMGNFPKLFGKAARMAAEKRGWKYLITTTPGKPADVTTQVLQMKRFGADYIYLLGSEAAAISWVKELDRQNFYPVLTGGGSSVGSGEMRNATGHLCDGAICNQYAPLWTDTDELITDLVHELNAEWHPEVKTQPMYYIRGFAILCVVAEALKRTVETVEYDNIDREAMKEAMETINDFKPAGMRIGFTWTPTDHQGIHDIRWYQWSKEGISVPITDWIAFPSLPMEQRTQDWWLQD